MNSQEEMVDEIKKRYGLKSPKVLSVMLQIPREKFAPRKYKDIAYRDGPVPIGYDQTMSQPYTVAFMTHLLISGKKFSSAKVTEDWRVLEIGTGSGYQAAILSKLAKEVYTIEIVEGLAKKAKKTLKRLGYDNVHVKVGSGQWGWEEAAPYDAIIVTAGVEKKVPRKLFDQLKEGGVLVAPVGSGYNKTMTKFIKMKGGRIKKEKHGVFHFVPFVEEKN
jgi:protein-L-isoaspartate(D-aspartate) O-methyltransferase